MGDLTVRRSIAAKGDCSIVDSHVSLFPYDLFSTVSVARWLSGELDSATDTDFTESSTGTDYASDGSRGMDMPAAGVPLSCNRCLRSSGADFSIHPWKAWQEEQDAGYRRSVALWVSSEHWASECRKYV